MSRTTLLLSGACGSGKTAAMRAMALSSPGETAVIDIDLVYTMVDPNYAIPFPEAERFWSLARRQCVRLAEGYFATGFVLVVIGGNAIYQRDRLNTMLPSLLKLSEVHHVTLDPAPDIIRERIAARAHPFDATKPPEWIDGHVRYMREHYETWTARIDNSDLTPDETARAIREAIRAGSGRLDAPFLDGS
jgi:hypothetical protein